MTGQQTIFAEREGEHPGYSLTCQKCGAEAYVSSDAQYNGADEYAGSDVEFRCSNRECDQPTVRLKL